MSKMSQADVIEVLEKIKKPLSRKEIAKELEYNEIRISHVLARLIKSRSIKIIEISREVALKQYNCKRRMRLYYI